MPACAGSITTTSHRSRCRSVASSSPASARKTGVPPWTTTRASRAFTSSWAKSPVLISDADCPTTQLRRHRGLPPRTGGSATRGPASPLVLPRPMLKRDNRSTMKATEECDYVIVGAGSAGCVLANRLTEDADAQVTVLEAGGPDHSVFIHMPAAFSIPLANDRYNWYYHTEPEPSMDGRRMYCPRGRVLGGSSSINGMVYIRGHAFDYDGWAQRPGLEQWSYAHCLPYFIRSENRLQGPDPYHGKGGPLAVTTPSMRNPLFGAFLQAAQQAGYAYTQDMNGYRQEGFGPMDQTTLRGRRWSTMRAYLRPAMARPNLQVLPRCLALRIVFEAGRAVGVEYLQRGVVRFVRARREVIASCGAINSPQLLMLSGIGEAEALRRLDIEVVADVPAVGRNLQDHIEIYVQHACTQPVSLYSTQ